jgi:hypothetical protein
MLGRRSTRRRHLSLRLSSTPRMHHDARRRMHDCVSCLLQRRVLRAADDAPLRCACPRSSCARTRARGCGRGAQQHAPPTDSAATSVRLRTRARGVRRSSNSWRSSSSISWRAAAAAGALAPPLRRLTELTHSPTHNVERCRRRELRLPAQRCCPRTRPPADTRTHSTQPAASGARRISSRRRRCERTRGDSAR